VKTYDVFQLGERQFALHFWPVTGCLERFEPGQYYATACNIVLSDGYVSPHDCIVRRHRARNFANVMIDHVYILIKSYFARETLSAAAYELAHVGKEISEAEAIAWKNSA